MMKAVIITVFVWAMQFSYRASAQTHINNDIYKIISIVVEHINPKIPIVDTLIPTVISSKFLRDQLEAKIVLNHTQKRRLKKMDAYEKGMLIDSNELLGFKIESYKPIFKTFRQFNSVQVEDTNNEIPFFLVGKPIIFASAIAFVDIDLIGRFGAIYILRKKNGKWEIINEIGKWYS